LAVAAKRAEVLLVQNGKSEWHVSLRPDPSSTELLAAWELVKYVRKISGVTLEVLQETVPSGQAILEFGGHMLSTLVPRSLFAEHPDYFRMNEKGQRIADHNFCPSSGAMDVLRENAASFFKELPEISYFIYGVTT